MSSHIWSRFVPLTQLVSLRAIFYMCLASLCFSVVELVGQHVVQNVSAYATVWFRYAVHLLFMIIVLGPRYRTKLVQTSNLKLQIVRSLTMLGMPVCFILAAQRMPANDVWAVYWTSPLVALALSTWVLRESAGTIRWAASLIGLVGVLFIIQPDAGIFAPAALLAFGMGVCISLHLMFSRILRHDHPLASLFYTALWVFLILCFFLPAFWEMPSLTSVVGMTIVGLVGMVGLFALARSGELAPLAVVASFAYTEVLWTVILNLVFFGILPGLRTVLGASVLVAATACLLFYEVGFSVQGKFWNTNSGSGI